MGKRSRAETAAAVDQGTTPTTHPAPASVAELIEAVAASTEPAARATGAAKFGVEFGIRRRPDGSAQLTDGTADATFRVFLEWSGSRDG